MKIISIDNSEDSFVGGDGVDSGHGNSVIMGYGDGYRYGNGFGKSHANNIYIFRYGNGYDDSTGRFDLQLIDIGINTIY